MNEVNPIAFYVFAGMAIAFSLLTVLKKNPVASAFSLVMAFFSFAGIYASLQAHLVATLQVLVYAGAIMVIFIFVIMLLNADEPSFDMKRSHPLTQAFAAVSCIALLALFVVALKKSGAGAAHSSNFTVPAIEAAGGNARVVSKLMFSQYLLPFELTSVLLLAAIVGAVAVAKRKLGKELK